MRTDFTDADSEEEERRNQRALDVCEVDCQKRY